MNEKVENIIKFAEASQLGFVISLGDFQDILDTEAWDETTQTYEGAISMRLETTPRLRREATELNRSIRREKVTCRLQMCTKWQGTSIPEGAFPVTVSAPNGTVRYEGYVIFK